MNERRSAGILLHVTSLPSRFGIGDLGPSALEFIDFLDDAGQKIWQILPLCPTSQSNSPYSSYSASAGNMLLISPERLLAQGWLKTQTLDELMAEETKPLDSASREFNSESDSSQVDFEGVTQFKRAMLKAAFVESKDKLQSDESFCQFCTEQAWWLDDFARFEALMELSGESDWTKWPEEIRSPAKSYSGVFENSTDDRLDDEVQFSMFKQFLFESQWRELKNYANQKEISICGDMPIFVAHQSADVWANQELFLLGEAGNPTSVAGVPPDYFSETGQLWGNPLYDWSAMESDGFAWWCNRFRRALDQFDLLRVDHFRGFDRYWKIPANAATAAEGVWESGPGEKPFRAAEQELGPLPIWAEDLGDIDQGVHDLRDRLGFPPMRVLQFGYSGHDDDFHRHTALPTHCIAYTGTHDNDTLMGWIESRGDSPENEGDDVLDIYLDRAEDQPIHFQMINLLYRSAANVAIVPLQDVLGLGNEARMNVPGEADGNWGWRVGHTLSTQSLAKQLREMVAASDRLIQPLLNPFIGNAKTRPGECKTIQRN